MQDLIPIELPLTEFLQQRILAFMLVLSRVGGLITFAPLLSSATFSLNIRIFLTLAISLLVAFTIHAPVIESYTMVDTIVLVLGELLIGFTLGTLTQLTFQGLQLGGQISGQQFGFALANITNPQFDDQVASTSVTFVTIASLIYLGLGFDRLLFGALLDSFHVIEPGKVFFNDSIFTYAIEVMQFSFIFAVRVAAPVTVALLLAELAMGFIGRTIPQLNILSIGFSVRIFIGLLMTAFSVYAVSYLFQDTFEEIFEETVMAIDSLIGPSP